MNRLWARLLIAMLLVALVSLLVLPLAQSLAVRRAFANLSPDFLERVQVQTRPQSPFMAGPRRERRLTLVDERQFLVEENVRLVNLLSDYRHVQNQAVFFGTAAAVVLAMGLAAWVSRNVAKPIEAVSQAAAELSRGNLRARVNLQGLKHRPDEAQQLARDFNAMAESLERYEGERKAMIADIAHELRNPLATMQMRLDALADGLVAFNDEEVRLLQGQVGLLARLVGDLRLLSLADAGRLSLELAPLELAELVRVTIRDYASRAESLGVALRFMPPAQAMLVLADRDRLAQVLHNLLDNALRVTPPCGQVEVVLATAGNEVALTVQDSGPGIPESELDAVFERFVQGKQRDTKSKTGSGLGLAIVQTLVTLQGGRVEASNHSSGATLSVILPRLKTEAKT